MDASHGRPSSAFTTQRTKESHVAGRVSVTTEKRACLLAGNQSRATRVQLQRALFSASDSHVELIGMEEMIASTNSFGSAGGIFEAMVTRMMFKDESTSSPSMYTPVLSNR